jgi:hypothetical protein
MAIDIDTCRVRTVHNERKGEGKGGWVPSYIQYVCVCVCNSLFVHEAEIIIYTCEVGGGNGEITHHVN